jgi:hypothetical protein
MLRVLESKQELEDKYERRNHARKIRHIPMDFKRKFAEKVLGFNFILAKYSDLLKLEEEISSTLKNEQNFGRFRRSSSVLDLYSRNSNHYRSWHKKITKLTLQKKIIRLEMSDRDSSGIFTSFGKAGDENGYHSWDYDFDITNYPFCAYWAHDYKHDDYDSDEFDLIREMCLCNNLHDIHEISCEEYESYLRKIANDQITTFILCLKRSNVHITKVLLQEIFGFIFHKTNF